MAVHRITELPEAAACGRLIVPTAVMSATTEILRASSGADGFRHEGLALWYGRRCNEDAVVVAAISPPTDHGPQHVFVSPGEVGRANRLARRHGLVLVAQVHSHPGDDTRHSEGDDTLIVMAHDGMFSLVVGDYGGSDHGPDFNISVHQRQGGRWVLVSGRSPEALVVAPSVLEGGGL